VPQASSVPSISLVIPAFDELDNLRVLLPEIHDLRPRLADVTLETFVIVATGASSHEVAEIESLGATVVKRGPTDSFGDAIRTGIKSVAPDSDFVVFMDADGSHSPARIPDLVHALKGADVVVASRYVAGGTSDNGLVLKAMSLALNRAYSLVLGIRCRDVSTNFKLYRASDLRRIRLACDNFDIVEEILVRVQDLKTPRRLRIVEIPDHFAQRRSGVTKRRLGPYIASYLWTLGKLRFSAGAGRTSEPDGDERI
jgi:dolichol-phosphate mannosyltransferase